VKISRKGRAVGMPFGMLQFPLEFGLVTVSVSGESDAEARTAAVSYMEARLVAMWTIGQDE